MTIALTGATGFVGQSLVGRLAAAGVPVRALARPLPGRALRDVAGLTWVAGDLDRPEALEILFDGVECVIHCAGATKATRPADFHRVNAIGTASVVAAARSAGVGHVIALSSLAATRPEVSAYAASKAAGEALSRRESGSMPVSLVRAPAVIGPGDPATAPLFSLLARGLLPVIGGNARMARFSVIDVADLAALIVDLARAGPPAGPGPTLAPCGHRDLGWSDMAASAARVTGRSVRQIVVPPALAGLLGRSADAVARISGRAQVFSSGKVREMSAGDWLGDAPLPAATPLDDTMGRCLAPFRKLGSVQR